MDIGNLITQDNAEKGVWFQAVLYGRKQPFDINILGEDSDTVQQYNKQRMRKLKNSVNTKNGNIESIDDETLDEFIETADENIIIRINGLRTHGKDEPLTLDGRELKDDKDSYSYLIEKIPDLKNFILKKSQERTNFLSDKKKS